MPQLTRLAALAALAFAPILAPAPAQAALPPWHQRAAELRAVLDAPGLVETIGDVEIERVEHAGPDLYRVSARHCHVDARIVSLPTPGAYAGPRRFAVRLGRRVCPVMR